MEMAQLEDTSYDIILLGTSLTETILAAALSRVGKKVLHLDCNEFYGGYYSSFNLQQLEALGAASKGIERKETKQWYDLSASSVVLENFESSSKEELAKEHEEQQQIREETTSTKEEKEEEKKMSRYEALKKESRQYSLDLFPKLFFSRGLDISLLISSGVSKYVEFKALENTFMYQDNQFQLVPSSKGDLFKSKYVSLIEKRILSKFLSSLTSNFSSSDDKQQQSSQEDANDDDNNNNNNNNNVDKMSGSFQDYLKKQGLTSKLYDFVVYAIALYSKEPSSTVSVEEGIALMKKYLSSLGVYSSSACLINMYGIGELPQAFSRLAAVFGGIYILRRYVENLIIEDNLYKGLVDSENTQLTSTNIVLSSDYIPNLMLNKANSRNISRCICICDTPIIENETQILLVIPPNKFKNTSVIRILQLDSGMSVCPKGKYVLHFSMESEKETARLDLEEAVKTVLSDKIQYYCYFNIRVWNGTDSIPNLPSNVLICNSINTDLDCESNVNEAKRLFNAICPGEEFLPMAPNPEDLVEDPDQEEPEN